MTDQAYSPSIESVLASRQNEERTQTLKKMAEKNIYVPISVTNDLLHLDLSLEEQAALICVTSSSNNFALEHFLTNSLAEWHQDLSVVAIHEWIKRTDRTLWFRLPALAINAYATQRIIYTLTDQARYCGGAHLLNAILKLPTLKDFSTSFHALLLQRCVQWNIESDYLKDIATNALGGAYHKNLDHRLCASALTYLTRFSIKTLEKLHLNIHTPHIWREHIWNSMRAHSQIKKSLSDLDKFALKAKEPFKISKILKIWPTMSARYLLNEQQVSTAIKYMLASSPPDDRSPHHDDLDWTWLSGCNQDVLLASLDHLSDDHMYLQAINGLQGLLPSPSPQGMLDKLVDRFRASNSPAQFIAFMNNHHRAELKLSSESTDKSNQVFDLIKSDEQTVLDTLNNDWSSLLGQFGWPDYDNKFEERSSWAENTLDLDPRKRFFDIAFRNQERLTPLGTGFWQLLAETWLTRSTKYLDKLASHARQTNAVWQLAYIKTLGRLVNEDAAVLKLLDFIRSEDDIEMKLVISALASIDTPRSLQELISCLTRSNVSTQLQLHICQVLVNKNLTMLQSELHSAIADIRASSTSKAEKEEILDSLMSLVSATKPQTLHGEQQIPPQVDSSNLDAELTKKIPRYTRLSSEVRRALRTAQFFDDQVSQMDQNAGIDLSPIIDMQYKALELTFREFFEGPCGDVINHGILQRKLDVIGYARPIPAMMGQFEHHIASLPTLQQIPYFSKFKLRKMLRAICQYRPGKRFTLDGLKAFALFFACFSRSQCRYGLQNLFPLPFSNDVELFEFVKMLHIFQDFRNRAAHEGFQPDAQADIAGIWKSTAEIIAVAFRLKEYLKAPPTITNIDHHSEAS